MLSSEIGDSCGYESFAERNRYAHELTKHCRDDFLFLYDKMFKFALVSGIPGVILARSLSISLSLGLVRLEHRKLRLQWSNSPSLLSTVKRRLLRRPSLQYLIFSEDVLTSLSQTLLLAFLSQVGNTDTSSPALHFICVGGPPINLILFQDKLVMDIPIPALLRENSLRGPFRVASFSSSLEYPSNSSLTLEVDIADGATSSVLSVESQYLERLVELFQRNEVTLVICQKRVHPYLQRLLHTHRIVCLPRVSVRFMSALLRLSGGRQLGGPPSHLNTSDPQGLLLDPSCLGQVESVRCEYLYGKPYVVVHGCNRGEARSRLSPEGNTFSTLLISSPVSVISSSL